MSDEQNTGDDLPKISRRRKRAAEEYFIGNCTKSEAYRRAGMARPGQTPQQIADRAYRLFLRPEVKAYLAHLAKQAEEEYELRKHKVLAKLYAAATSSVKDLFDDKGDLLQVDQLSAEAAASISSVEVEELFEGRGEDREQIGVLRKVKTVDPNRAAEVLGKMLGWVKEKVEHSGSIETPKLELVLHAPGTPRETN